MNAHEDLRREFERAQQGREARNRAEMPAFGSEHLTDAGNAQRLVRLHGEDLHYVHGWKRWLVWDGRRWAFNETGEVTRRAKATVRTIYEEAARATDSDQRRAIAEHAKRSESDRRIMAMIHLAQSEPGIPIRHNELDSDPWLFNVSNGTLDLRTGELHAHARADLITKIAPVPYEADATAPIWEEFLQRVLPDPEIRLFVQRAAGYSMTGSTEEQCLFFLWGGGANGKSTFLETMRATLGDYAMHTPADTLLAKRDTGIPNDIARLRGARFVTAVETEQNRRLAEAQVKQLTGGDTVSARYMRAEWFEFRPVAKIWLATNHKPAIRGTDDAIWRRIRMVPFTVTIPEEERDPKLPEKLQVELPGILTWAVTGCLEWGLMRLRAPEGVVMATKSYREEQDLLGVFIQECCVVHEDAKAPTAELYAAYRQWAEAAGERPQTQKAFGDRLTERGFEPRRFGKRSTWHRFGIALPIDEDGAE